MTYVLHYVSADLDLDRPNLLSWSVYREEYPSLADSDGDPIVGSTVRVSSHATEAEADAEANRLQATANLCRCGAPASDKAAHPGRYITGLAGHTFAPQ